MSSEKKIEDGTIENLPSIFVRTYEKKENILKVPALLFADTFFLIEST